MFSEELLKELKNNSVHLLDIPNHDNVGDYLILYGELNYFKKNNVKLKSISSIKNFNYNLIKKNDILIFHGGGNFGDLYFNYTKFKAEITRKFSNNRIILMPQTIYFKDKKKLLNISKVFSRHSNITIFARDNSSYELFKKYFKKNKVILNKDMANYLDINNFKNKSNQNKSNKILYLSRTDFESNQKLKLSNRNIKISDWFNFSLFNYWKYIHIIFMVFRKFTTNKFYTKLLLIYGRYLVKYSIKRFNKFNLIITDRLHGLILANLLNIKVISIDNSYHKVKNYYETWLKFEKNTYFINDKNELKLLLKKLNKKNV